MDPSRLDDLLDLWEEARRDGKSITVGDLCGDDTALADALREKIQALQAMNRLLDFGAESGRDYSALETGDEFGAAVDWDRLERLGQYRILGVLGAGGMGVVLRAEDPSLGRQVAIKVMRPDKASAPHSRARFLREARSAAAVRHPRVVEIYHVGQWENTPFLVMPLMVGQSLAERLKSQTPIPLADAVRFARETADGLAAAHSKNLIHRDIKPDNLWLEETAEGTHVRLLDFGIARIGDAEALTHSGAFLGTPYYMAPEQAAGKPVDARTDLFSLGCVLYELLTRQKPFQGASIVELVYSLSHTRPRPPREWCSAIPQDLSDLVLSLLETDPAARPATAVQVAAELRKVERTLVDRSKVETSFPRRLRSGWRASGTWKPVWFVGATICFFAVGLLLWALRNPLWNPGVPGPAARTTPSGHRWGAKPEKENASVTAPLRVTEIQVTCFRRTPEGQFAHGEIIGQNLFGAVRDDAVQVRTKLSRPAYAYLVVCRPDGHIDLCFPESEDQPPPLDDSPRYPLKERELSYGLNEGVGLWVFAVIASTEPLPAFRDWDGRSRLAGAWVPVRQVPAKTVWWDDGESQLHILTPQEHLRDTRGKAQVLRGPAEAIVRLSESLQSDPGIVPSALGFSVLPRGETP